MLFRWKHRRPSRRVRKQGRATIGSDLGRGCLGFRLSPFENDSFSKKTDGLALPEPEKQRVKAGALCAPPACAGRLEALRGSGLSLNSLGSLAVGMWERGSPIAGLPSKAPFPRPAIASEAKLSCAASAILAALLACPYRRPGRAALDLWSAPVPSRTVYPEVRNYSTS